MPFSIPFCLLTDSYKTTHPFLYPRVDKLTAYGEFRSSYEKCSQDSRLIFYGMRYILENYICVQWTLSDLEKAELFFSTHHAGGTPFPFPKELFLKFIQENNGYFPVVIESLPEGSVIYPHVPVYQITAEKEFAGLVTYLETLLTMVWYPSTVATLSRRCKDYITDSYKKTVDKEGYWTLESRLHDFGFRACTSVEQSIIGGTAHLLNFSGTDTLSAAYYAQFHLNQGSPVGYSIPATEHSVMTAHLNEKEAMTQLLSLYGSGVCACVMDSYDYTNALEKVLPSVASLKTKKGGFLVLRPDSGDPIQVVIQALKAADSIFGSVVNKLGFKVLNGVGVIQGDGISHSTIKSILDTVEKEGYSAQNVAFGMGGGLLQKIHRDTMSFATKLNKIVYMDGTTRNVMKRPKTDSAKISLPGELAVALNADGLPIVYPKELLPLNVENQLKIVYDHGPLSDPQWSLFSDLRATIQERWEQSPMRHDPFSKELRSKIESTLLTL